VVALKAMLALSAPPPAEAYNICTCQCCYSGICIDRPNSEEWNGTFQVCLILLRLPHTLLSVCLLWIFWVFYVLFPWWLCLQFLTCTHAHTHMHTRTHTYLAGARLLLLHEVTVLRAH